MSRRLIDADALERAMYEEAFEKDTDMQRWDSGCWIRYKLYERVLDAQPTVDIKPQWIPCKERLPKIGTNVLITNDKGNVSYGRYRGVYPIDDNRIWWAWKKNTLENVLAWMPLPKPYEGVKE